MCDISLDIFTGVAFWPTTNNYNFVKKKRNRPISMGGSQNSLKPFRPDLNRNKSGLVVTLRSYISLIEYSCIYS